MIEKRRQFKKPYPRTIDEVKNRCNVFQIYIGIPVKTVYVWYNTETQKYTHYSCWKICDIT